MHARRLIEITCFRVDTTTRMRKDFILNILLVFRCTFESRNPENIENTHNFVGLYIYVLVVDRKFDLKEKDKLPVNTIPPFPIYGLHHILFTKPNAIRALAPAANSVTRCARTSSRTAKTTIRQKRRADTATTATATSCCRHTCSTFIFQSISSANERAVFVSERVRVQLHTKKNFFVLPEEHTHACVQHCAIYL